jgi:outer membrane protein assembly factor BamE (lipoprotein component of BamABCDE complex)
MKFLLSSAVLLVAAAACGGPKARIKDNEELFASYPPNVQALIRAGEIDRGFDTTQVYMALGSPHSKEPNPKGEIWSYTQRWQRQVQEEKGAVEYENERLKYEQARARGEQPPEPVPYRVVTYYRTQVVRLVHFETGKVVADERPTDRYLDEWHT